MSKFKVGDHVFYAKSKPYQEIQVPCLVCYGKREVVLVLGNDDRVTLRCDYCRRGYDSPTGFITEQVYIAEAYPTTITSVHINQTTSGETAEYHFGSHCCADEDLIFDNKEDALEKAMALKAKYDEERHTRADYIKQDVKKKYSWNAGYHLRAKKKSLEDAEYHNRMAVLCKAKAKPE